MSAIDDLIGRVQARCHDDGEGWDEAACWIWEGRMGAGYKPQITIEGANRYVRRVLLAEIAAGPMPRKWVAARTCESACCVNPTHMKATSKARAAKFAVARRATKSPMRIRKMAATRRARSIYSDALIESIRTAENGAEIARAAGMSKAYAWSIRAGRQRKPLCTPFSGLAT